MKISRLAGLLLPFMLLTGCIAQPAHREAGTHALLRSWMPILSVNGELPEDAYRMLLLPGDYELQVLYRTYRRDYLCLFEFSAEAGKSYEIVDHSNEEPLVLYRWVRANGAWAERRDPVAPLCESSSREQPGA